MPFEALAWTLIIILGPSLIAAIKPRLENIEHTWLELAGWIHAAGLPFLALVLGSISARAAGITRFDPVTWSPGLLAAALGFLAAVLARRVLPNPPAVYSTPLDVLRFEPRWALYRAAAALWIGGYSLSVGAALLLGTLEWALNLRPWKKISVGLPDWSRLLRLAFSSLLFWATRNLWITIGLQLALVLLLQYPAPGSGGPRDETLDTGKSDRA
jgi:hypothetical protein